MKIAICGLIKSENIGELFIARSLEYIIETECRKRQPEINLEFVEVDLLGRNDTIVEVSGAYEKRVRNYYNYSEKGIPLEKLFLWLKKKVKTINNRSIQNIIHRLRHFIWKHGRNYRKRLNDYFYSKLEGVDFIVIDGAGLLEYSYNEYQWSLYLISEYAEKHNLSVVYNAIGKAGEFDERDFRSTILKAALRSDAVKYVSARDSQETVQLCAGNKHHVKLLADAAFWMKEAYQIEPCTDNKKIGIGLIRGNSLVGYGVDFGTQKWVELFAGIAECLSERGYEYEFFTNGLPGDTKLGKKVLKKLGLPESYLVKRPTGDVELYNTINSYSAMITCRMHSAIAAFTLRTPSVILSWNDKVNKLMEIIGYPERAINLPDFEPPHIVDCMEKAMKEGVGQDKLDVMKSKALESVDDYIEMILEANK